MGLAWDVEVARGRGPWSSRSSGELTWSAHWLTQGSGGAADRSPGVMGLQPSPFVHCFQKITQDTVVSTTNDHLFSLGFCGSACR